jgi:antitoxin YefM
MDVIPYSTVSANLAKTMDRVCDNHEPIVIDRPSDKSVVMISLEDYRSLEETAYLLKNPANAKRLLESIAELESGGGIERELLE